MLELALELIRIRPTTCVVNSYASKHQTVVNEPIYKGNSHILFDTLTNATNVGLLYRTVFNVDMCHII